MSGIRVFKIGGSVIGDEASFDSFCRAFASVEGPKVLVHGGGVMASSLQKSLGQVPVKIEGRRVTDADALKAVTMAYAGWCNKSLVAALQKYGCNALGLSGADADIVRAEKRSPKLLQDGVTLVDYGFVGDVKPSSVDTVMLRGLLSLGLTPVLCAINHDGNGQLLNTNADTVASCIAAALGGELVCCFELEGVMRDINDPSSVIPLMTGELFNQMKASGTVSDGMIPKIENCLDALRGGASLATIKSALRIGDESGTKVTL